MVIESHKTPEKSMFWLFFSCTKDISKQEDNCLYPSSPKLINEQLLFSENDCQQLELSSSILGSSGLSVRWSELNGAWQPTIIAETSASFKGLVLEGDYLVNGDEPPLIWKQGYQSWWWSGVTDENNIRDFSIKN